MILNCEHKLRWMCVLLSLSWVVNLLFFEKCVWHVFIDVVAPHMHGRVCCQPPRGTTLRYCAYHWPEMKGGDSWGVCLFRQLANIGSASLYLKQEYSLVRAAEDAERSVGGHQSVRPLTRSGWDSSMLSKYIICFNLCKKYL